MIHDDNDTTSKPRFWPYYYRGWRYWQEGFYIWLGKRLPAGLVFYATNQLREYAEDQGLPVYDILEAQSAWLDKLPK